MNDILKYKDYLASVQFNADDEVFRGKILGINDQAAIHSAKKICH
jgi:predicted HicB family RNase H-like nuclease